MARHLEEESQRRWPSPDRRKDAVRLLESLKQQPPPPAAAASDRPGSDLVRPRRRSRKRTRRKSTAQLSLRETNRKKWRALFDEIGVISEADSENEETQERTDGQPSKDPSIESGGSDATPAESTTACSDTPDGMRGASEPHESGPIAKSDRSEPTGNRSVRSRDERSQLRIARESKIAQTSVELPRRMRLPALGVADMAPSKNDEKDNTVGVEHGGVTRETVRVRSKKIPLRFQAATWNVWFGDQGDGSPFADLRMKAIVRELLRRDNDFGDSDFPLLFLGFQEVTTATLAPLIQGLKVSGFDHFVQQENGSPHFCLLGIRQGVTILDSGWHGYNQNAGDGAVVSRSGIIVLKSDDSSQRFLHGKEELTFENGTTILVSELSELVLSDLASSFRGFCYARVVVGPGKQQLLVATTHLQSYSSPHYTGAPKRRQQLLEWKRFCERQMKLHPDIQACVFMGDLNVNDENYRRHDDKLERILNCPFKDTWKEHLKKQIRELKANEGRAKIKVRCYTYDALKNPMLGSGGQRLRLDRCLVFTRTYEDLESVDCSNTELLGKEALPGLFFDKYNSRNNSYRSNVPVAPSDHYGFVSAITA